MEQRTIYHPYHRYAIEKEAERKGITDLDRVKRRVRNHDNEAFFRDDMSWAFNVSMVNFIPVVFLHLFIALSSLLGMIYLLWRIFSKR
jgi:DNA-binding MltR family transcriptional regulator